MLTETETILRTVHDRNKIKFLKRFDTANDANANRFVQNQFLTKSTIGWTIQIAFETTYVCSLKQSV